MKVRDLELYLRYSLSKDILLRFLRSNIIGLLAIFIIVNLIDFYDFFEKDEGSKYDLEVSISVPLSYSLLLHKHFQNQRWLQKELQQMLSYNQFSIFQMLLSSN